MDNMDCPAFGKEHVIEIIGKTLPPYQGVPENHFFDGYLFIDTLALAIILENQGKLLLSELKKKWPEAVNDSMDEAIKKALDTLDHIKKPNEFTKIF